MADELHFRLQRGQQKNGKIHISNIPFTADETKIRELYSDVGRIERLAVNYDKYGKSRGTAEIIFTRYEDAVRATEKFNRIPLFGRHLVTKMIGEIPHTKINRQLVNTIDARYKETTTQQNTQRSETETPTTYATPSQTPEMGMSKLRRAELKSIDKMVDRMKKINEEKKKLDDAHLERIEKLTLDTPREELDDSLFYKRPDLSKGSHHWTNSPILYWETPENLKEMAEWPGIRYVPPQVTPPNHIRNSPLNSEDNEFSSSNTTSTPEPSLFSTPRSTYKPLLRL